MPTLFFATILVSLLAPAETAGQAPGREMEVSLEDIIKEGWRGRFTRENPHPAWTQRGPMESTCCFSLGWSPARPSAERSLDLACWNALAGLAAQKRVHVMGVLDQSTQQVVGANPDEIVGTQYVEEITRSVIKNTAFETALKDAVVVAANVGSEGSYCLLTNQTRCKIRWSNEDPKTRPEWVDMPPALGAVGIWGLADSDRDDAIMRALLGSAIEVSRQISSKITATYHAQEDPSPGEEGTRPLPNRPDAAEGTSVAEEIIRTLSKRHLTGLCMANWWWDPDTDEIYQLVTISSEHLKESGAEEGN